jgi:hypothetical protein
MPTSDARAQIIEPEPSLDLVRKSRIRTFPEVRERDAILIREGYRVFSFLRNQGWPRLFEIFPTPLVLITDDSQYLFGHPAPPEGYFLTRQTHRVFKHVYGVERSMDCGGSVDTRPLYGAPTIIMPSLECADQNPTEWIFDYVRGAFRLYSYSRNELLRVARLDVPFPDPENEWKQTFPFPGRDPDVIKAFDELANYLAKTFWEVDADEKRELLRGYAPKRARLREALDALSGEHSNDDFFRYMCWSDGLAHYVAYSGFEQIKSTKRTVRDLEGFVNYTTFVSRDVRAPYTRFLREGVGEEITAEDIMVVGALTAGIVDQIVPDWRQFALERGVWLEDLMARAVVESP